jgi:hypothetical protein
MDWKRLFRTARSSELAPSAASAQFPVHVEILPGELSAAIHLHIIDTNRREIPCWSYVTEGLARHGQREMIFTLVRQAGELAENYARDPLGFFQTILNLSKQGRTVDAGDFTRLRGPEFMGFSGITYIQPVWLPPDNVSDRLAMIGLLEDEIAALQEFGATRVLNILGNAERFYPAPYWTERNRPSCMSPKWSASILANIRRVPASGFRVFKEENRIILRAHAGAARRTTEALRSLPPSEPLALLTAIDPSADAALVWHPGQTEPHAITPPGGQGRRLCGSFVILLPEQETDKEELFEDGYVLHLTSATCERLRNAIVEQENLQTPVFEVRWIPDGFEEYLPWPREGARMQTGCIRAVRIILLQPDTETMAAITVEALAAFTKTVESAVDARFTGYPSRTELRITIEVRPGSNASYELATRSPVDDSILQQLWKDLQKCSVPAVKKPIRFAVELEIHE